MLLRVLSVLILLAGFPVSQAAYADSRQTGCALPQQKPARKSTVVHQEFEGTVEVSFRIDETGRAEILNIAATSPQLAEYVIKKLAQISLGKDDPQIGQVIRYRFVFRKQA
jgi:hypothetical protein